MQRLLLSTFLLFLFIAIADAQDAPKKESPPTDYFTFRIGFWYPKDTDLEYQGKTATTINAEIDRSQAVGGDLHYRSTVGRPLYTDFSLGAWYSSYTFKYRQTNLPLPSDISSYSLIVPLTIGLSISPLMETPFHPYAMIGGGVYVAFTGFKETKKEIQVDDSKIFGKPGFFFGLGFDFMLSQSFGLSAGLKYHFVEFNQVLSTEQQNFTGPQIQIGAVMKR